MNTAGSVFLSLLGHGTRRRLRKRLYEPGTEPPPTESPQPHLRSTLPRDESKGIGLMCPACKKYYTLTSWGMLKWKCQRCRKIFDFTLQDGHVVLVPEEEK